MRIPAAALLPLLLAVTPAGAQTVSRDWRPADRTVIGDFSRITAIAAALDRVFVASPTAVLIWHPQFRTWEGPYDPPNDTELVGVFAGLVDPLDQSLWLARSDGWVHFQPDLQIWDQGQVSGGVQSIAFDQNDPVAGLYVRSQGGWQVVPRGGFLAMPTRPPARPVAPISIDEVLRQSPTLQTNASQILLDPRLRATRYTAAARSFDNLGWYIGTSGVGLLYLPDGAALPDRLTFGLPSTYTSAVTSWPGGVWVATDRTSQTDAALTYVDAELREFRSVRGLPASGPGFTRVLDLAGQGTAVWAATDRGLARIESRDGRIDLLDERRGLPDSRVYDVASRQGRITIGTARGVVRVGERLEVERLAPQFVEAAYAVFPIGDSVWVGTSRGVLVAASGDQDLVRPAGINTAGLQQPVIALASLADTLVGLGRDQLMWRDPVGTWTLGPTLSGVLGRLRRFVADGPGFWVAGDRGVGFVRLGGPALLTLREGDLPGISNDLAVDPQHLWVATDRGLVRFRLDAIRP
jgi:ligand-binding sensor domain-containing protein